MGETPITQDKDVLKAICSIYPEMAVLGQKRSALKGNCPKANIHIPSPVPRLAGPTASCDRGQTSPHRQHRLRCGRWAAVPRAARPRGWAIPRLPSAPIPTPGQLLPALSSPWPWVSAHIRHGWHRVHGPTAGTGTDDTVPTSAWNFSLRVYGKEAPSHWDY